MDKEQLLELYEILIRRIRAVDRSFDNHPESLSAIAEATKALILLMPHIKE